MKIGIVLHPYGEKHPAGLARTIFEFTKGMLEVDQTNEYLIFVKSPQAPKPDLPGANWSFHALGEGRFWLDRLRKAPQADVYIFNTPVLPLVWKPPRSIVLALDFAYKHLPAEGLRDRLLRFASAWYHQRSMRRADAVVAISEATRRDAIELFHIAPEKVVTIHCGFKKICDLPEARVETPDRFFLFVGVLKHRKNVLNVVQGYHRFVERYPNAKELLVIAGRGSSAYASHVHAYVQESALEDRVRFVGFVSDEQLSYVYRRASAFVFPSFIEGFGFPLLEAMDCGTPVVTSDRSSLAEIAGDAALLVDPNDPEAIARAMADVAFEPAVRERLQKVGLERAAQFSWQKAGSELLAMVKSFGQN